MNTPLNPPQTEPDTIHEYFGIKERSEDLGFILGASLSTFELQKKEGGHVYGSSTLYGIDCFLDGVVYATSP